MPDEPQPIADQDVKGEIARAMQADRFRLRRTWDQIRRDEQAGKLTTRQREKFFARLRDSVSLKTRRASRVPAIAFDNELPVNRRRAEIAAAIRDHQVVIICGETGSGKSTQLPKICLEMGRGIDGFIGHTQPRRVAARSVAARLAEELGSPLGNAAGFKVRFSDQTRPDTFIKLMTDGILLAETAGDRFLDQYDTLILDEAHERSLNIDFLLGYVRRLLPKRPGLRLIVTSATIDVARFSDHFGSADHPAPVIEVSGRSWPVEVRYRPPAAENADDEKEPDLQRCLLDAVDEISAEDRQGDMLVFLPTEREIREAAKSLRGRLKTAGVPTEILPLYARLSLKEQNRVFQPHNTRRIVLATNVAESSLTVPGIRYVIDTGTARISRYAARSKIQRLPIEAISQASADQRKGRCGRVGPGVCVRLYDEQDFVGRDRYTTPEIRRTNLAAVILQSMALKLGPIERFPFLDPPHPAHVREGYRTLFELGAIDERNELTGIGQRLSRLPVDPRIGRMILAADEENCLREVLIIASVLESQDPRERPVERQQAADEAHARFANSQSDFLALLNVWDFYHDLKTRLSRNQLRKACKQNFLSFNRMREWLDTHRQLAQLADECLPGKRRKRNRRASQATSGQAPSGQARSGQATSGQANDVERLDVGASAGQTSPAQSSSRPLPDREDKETYARIHRALLAGLLANVAQKTDAYEYTGAGGTKLVLWPGSGTFEEKSRWIVAAELVETSRRYARTVARINSDWIEPLAGHLVKRTYSDPHWHGKSGTVMAFERVTLFGMTVVPRRRTGYGKIDPAVSRSLFIRHGLVEGDVRLNARFFARNQELRDEIAALAARTRRSDMIIDDQTVADFYDDRLPADVFDVARLNGWLKSDSANGDRLAMTREDLLGAEEHDPGGDAFPDQLEIGTTKLPLSYRFEPGNDHDGITVTVPRDGLNQVSADRLGWLVPGLLEQKLLSLIRSLPKSIRRNLVPAPDTAREAVARLQFGRGAFLAEVAKVLTELSGEPVSADSFRLEKIADHLQMNVRVVDADNAELAVGRDLEELRREAGGADGAAVLQMDDDRWTRDGMTKWDFGELPAQVEVSRGGVQVAGFPALEDAGKSVSLRLLNSQPHAAQLTRGGVRRLFMLSEHKALKAHVEWFPDLNRLLMYATPICGAQSFREQLAELIADRAYLGVGKLPRDERAFESAIQAGRDRCEIAVQEVVRVVRPMMENWHEVAVMLEDATSARVRDVAEDIRGQLAEFGEGRFLTDTPWMWLRNYPRYLQACSQRLEKLGAAGATRDREAMAEIRTHWARYEDRLGQHVEHGVFDPELQTYRWMIEEYRVSLFAQKLGTSVTVSPQRLEKQWAKVV